MPNSGEYKRDLEGDEVLRQTEAEEFELLLVPSLTGDAIPIGEPRNGSNPSTTDSLKPLISLLIFIFVFPMLVSPVGPLLEVFRAKPQDLERTDASRTSGTQISTPTNPGTALVFPTSSTALNTSLPHPPRFPDLPSDQEIQVTSSVKLSSLNFKRIQTALLCWGWNGTWVKQLPDSAVRYRWTPNPGACTEGDYQEMLPRRLCDVIKGRSVALLGDSITYQHFDSLVEAVGKHPTRSNRREFLYRPPRSAPATTSTTPPAVEPVDAENRTIIPLTPAQKALYNHSWYQPLCRDKWKQQIHVTRSDRLLLDNDPDRVENYYFIDEKWLEELKGFNGIVIVNRGAHWEKSERYLPALRKALEALREAAPDALVFFRTTPPGHSNCSLRERPLDQPETIEGLPWHWGYFWGQNNEAANLIWNEFPGIFVLDVSYASGLRADGHRANKNDCLHYIDSDPYHAWNDMMGNAMRMVTELGASKPKQKAGG